MKKLSAISLALAALFTVGAASANNMYINLPNNTYDASAVIGPGVFPGVRPFDLNTQTAIFNEFGFSQILATSIYAISGGSLTGSFYDTNIPAELTAAGIPAASFPDCPNGQCDIDALSPLVPPLTTDNEGYLQTWDLQVEYHFDGVLTPGGPVYNSGTFTVYFNDTAVAGLHDGGIAIQGTLTGSQINLANLDLYFDITYVVPNFLFISNGSSFVDAFTQVGTATPPTLHLDTNVNPPIPDIGSLIPINATSAYRQTTLDGSITAAIPEPSTIALLGIALFGIGAIGRRARG